MEATETTKLYFFIKKHLQEDLEKRDIKELAKTRFPKMTDEEFDIQFSEAFKNL